LYDTNNTVKINQINTTDAYQKQKITQLEQENVSDDNRLYILELKFPITNVFILNETTNKWLTLSTSKQHFYSLLVEILPKQKQKKVAYIKKIANSNKEEYDIASMSNTLELSKREVKVILEILKTVSQ
jgi:hypothetical protein